MVSCGINFLCPIRRVTLWRTGFCLSTSSCLLIISLVSQCLGFLWRRTVHRSRGSHWRHVLHPHQGRGSTNDISNSSIWSIFLCVALVVCVGLMVLWMCLKCGLFSTRCFQFHAALDAIALRTHVAAPWTLPGPCTCICTCTCTSVHGLFCVHVHVHACRRFVDWYWSEF